MANEESNNAKLIFLSIQFNIITRKKRRACLRFIMEKMNYFSYFRMFLLIFLYLWCFYDLELKGGLMRDWQRIRKKCLKNLESLKSRRKFFYPDKSPQKFSQEKNRSDVISVSINHFSLSLIIPPAINFDKS